MSVTQKLCANALAHGRSCANFCAAPDGSGVLASLPRGDALMETLDLLGVMIGSISLLVTVLCGVLVAKIYSKQGMQTN